MSSLENTPLDKLLEIANLMFGTNAKTFDELGDHMLPEDCATAKRLSVFYEVEMIACRDAKSYFGSCVMGAAMLEAFLLLLCLSNQEKVQQTEWFSKRAGTKKRDVKQVLTS